MWWPTSDELKRAGVITGIARPDDFALSGFGTAATDEDTEGELQKIPLFGSIKRVDPEVYTKISAAMIEARKLGKSQAELVAVMMPYVSNLSKKYLPVASDDAVIAAAELAVTEAETIGSKSPDACYDFLYPRPGSRPVILSEYLAGDVQHRDLLTTAAVIETGSTTPQRIPTEKEVSPLLKRVVDQLTQRYPAADIAALANPNSPEIEHERTCRMTIALFREVLALPTKDKVRLLRFFFAQ
jgi:hypothetical protein